ncbi:MAG TPA: GntR family transcriptional regulator [Coriobacteriia bacterium]|nr:GntR family transcriptional regulator [Coriobacteriia bacterium]
MRLIVSNRSGTPIYEQIKSQIKEAIFSGELIEDEMLPSIRQLARDLQISVITTTRAYNDLEAEGFIYSVQGKGNFVLPRSKELARENALHKIEVGLMTTIELAKVNDVSEKEIIERIKILWEEGNEQSVTV